MHSEPKARSLGCRSYDGELRKRRTKTARLALPYTHKPKTLRGSSRTTKRPASKLEPTRTESRVPIGSLVVPFWDFLIVLSITHKKGTTMEPMGSYHEPYKALRYSLLQGFDFQAI